MLKLVDISKSFYLGPVQVEILKGVDLEVEKGELLCIVGSSGCGKSTLMNILGFLDIPDKGRYIFEDREMRDLSDSELSGIRNRKIGFVFQQFFLLPKLRAVDNVCLPLVYRGMGKKQRDEIGMRMLEKVGMADRGGHKPSELSGGQQQRVAIARALAASPSLILADEPTGALDKQTSRDIIDLFWDLNQTQGITVVLITHDPEIARECPRVIRMEDGRVFPG
ncbi:MAG: ABC transporter ATP-binding protein [Desulfonatronovibrionaceae bacterium]